MSKIFSFICLLALTCAVFGQALEASSKMAEDIQYLQELVLDQAIQINQLSQQTNALPMIADNQVEYSRSILSSLTVVLASSIIGAVGAETRSDVPKLLAIGGGVSAITIRISGIIEYAKGAQKAKSLLGLEIEKSKEKKSIGQRIKDANEAYSVVREERIESKFSRLEQVEFELKKGLWVDGLIDEVLEWEEDVYKYRVSFSNDKGKKKSKFVDEQQIRLPL